MFEIIGVDYIEYEDEDTLHQSEERSSRKSLVERLFESEGMELLDSFIVEKGHVNGREVHNIYRNGIIRIYNEKTGKHITDLIGRPAQIDRYYVAIDEYPPTMTMLYAEEHENKGYNNR